MLFQVTYCDRNSTCRVINTIQYSNWLVDKKFIFSNQLNNFLLRDGSGV
jgi:hypothetical protein